MWCKSFILLLLLKLVTVNGAPSPKPLECRNPRSTICAIQNVIYVDFEIPQLPSLQGKHTLQIRSGNVTRFSEELSSSMGSITKLQLGRLDIKSLWIMPQLIHLSAEGNHIEHLNVNSELDYSLQTLNVMNNRLRSVHELGSFTELKELRLDGNDLEYLEMDTFAQMVRLKKLSLSRNRISAISTTESVKLPSLEYLSLAFNNLSKLSVEKWELLQLSELELNNNRLVSLDVASFDKFVSLEKLAIAGNAWYCFWLSKALSTNAQKYVTLAGLDKECPAMPIQDICCSMTVIAEDQLAYGDIAERIRLFNESHQRIKSELLQKVDRVDQKWFDEFNEIARVAKEKDSIVKQWELLAGDDNKVQPEDVTEMIELLDETGNRLNELQSLGETNAAFETEITKLMYAAIEQKNKLQAEMKNATNLEHEMDKYKISFDANVQ